MDFFHYAEFGNLKYVHHNIETFSRFQWASDHISEKDDSVITHLLEVMAFLFISVYFKYVLTSMWKPGHVLFWGRGFALVSIGEEKL